MTDKEKARKIMETFTEVYGVNIERDSHIYSACTQMAQWKESQMIEKACEWLSHNTMRELLMDSELTELVSDFVEDFKKAMEE